MIALFDSVMKENVRQVQQKKTYVTFQIKHDPARKHANQLKKNQ